MRLFGSAAPRKSEPISRALQQTDFERKQELAG